MNRSLLVVLSLLCVMQLWGQGVKIAELQYISPKPGSKFIMPGNNIALRYSEKFDPNSVKQSILNVKSTRSGEISGSIKLSDDGKTVLFKPKSLFPLGDIIHVTLNKGLRTLSGIDIVEMIPSGRYNLGKHTHRYELGSKKQIVADPHNSQISEDMANVAIPNRISPQAHPRPDKSPRHGG